VGNVIVFHVAFEFSRGFIVEDLKNGFEAFVGLCRISSCVFVFQNLYVLFGEACASKSLSQNWLMEIRALLCRDGNTCARRVLMVGKWGMSSRAMGGLDDCSIG
jgi:hypothetical protein